MGESCERCGRPGKPCSIHDPTISGKWKTLTLCDQCHGAIRQMDVRACEWFRRYCAPRNPATPILAFLAPKIVEAIAAGHQPPELTAKTLPIPGRAGSDERGAPWSSAWNSPIRAFAFRSNCRNPRGRPVRRRPGRKLPRKRLSLYGRFGRRGVASRKQTSWFAAIAEARTWLRVSSSGGIADAASVSVNATGRRHGRGRRRSRNSLTTT